MIATGLSGSLLSLEALTGPLIEQFDASRDRGSHHEARRCLHAWHLSVRSTLGPTASARTVLDLVALPLVGHLGFQHIVMSRHGTPYALLQRDGKDASVLFVTNWGQDAGGAWSEAVRRGIGHDVRWCLCVTGPALRIFDATRAYSRRFAEFDLALTIEDEGTFRIFWSLLRAEALAPGTGPSSLDRAVELCEQHRAAVSESLKGGVQEALTHLSEAFGASKHKRSEAQALDESLIVIYRVLFLLFAEARGLVPQWHPVYRDCYTVESLRHVVEANATPRGLWEALQAIARLAHRGCRAGALRVAAFNGRLFSPADAPLADTLRLDDEAVRRALLALTTRQAKSGRQRIAYAELGVEQLGAVYEHVLDYVPGRPSGRRVELRPGTRRKATGTFYTPRSLTEYLVRRALAPLVHQASPAAILALRVVDPAMGSGAFLVAACRYLGRAYEEALVREEGLNPSDITEPDRIAFRRVVAQRCLFGVDINPMAVQLARLSLWLATLAADRPLTFLDHHLRSGDSLVGASLTDIHRQPPSHGRGARAARLPLFAPDAFEAGLRAIVAPRLALAQDADDTLEQVKRKERTLARLADEEGPLGRWKLAANLWCAGWFSNDAKGITFGTLLRHVLDGQGPLPEHLSGPLLASARAAAASRRFFHWTLEFPEVFYREDGTPLDSPGFDAVLGNPPWEMLRADDGTRESARAGLTRFSRDSGIYRLQGTGHPNLYQLFLERGLSLARAGGRLGFLVPAGLATDHGCAALRRELLGRTTIDTFVTCENRNAIFPIHRSVKFTLFTLTKGGETLTLPLHTGIRASEALDRLSDRGETTGAIAVPHAVLRRLSGDLVVIPGIRSRNDLDLISRITHMHPALGDPDGWGVRFGRELNATDDRPELNERGTGYPVLEGKHVRPFRIDRSAARLSIAWESAARLLPARPFAAPRLAYRDVASATNRLTLIAAIVPAWVVTTHTLFCAKKPPDLDVQHFLCGIFNSFVANHLVRMRVSTHVTASVIEQLPVPTPGRSSGPFRELAELSRRLSHDDDAGARAQQQALAAALYGIEEGEFAYVLDAFPLISRGERDAALECFRCIVR